jgi:hypothetical protein
MLDEVLNYFRNIRTTAEKENPGCDRPDPEPNKFLRKFWSATQHAAQARTISTPQAEFYHQSVCIPLWFQHSRTREQARKLASEKF